MGYGLPVHHLGGDASSVYAYRDELDRWLRKRDGWDESAHPVSAPVVTQQTQDTKRHRPAEVHIEQSSAEAEAGHLIAGAQRLWESLSSSNLSTIVLMYRRATDLDPLSAVGHAGLSQALIAQAVLGNLHPAAAFHTARAALRRALEIDPDLFEGLCASAIIKVFVERDWEGARVLLDEAVQMQPKASQALVGSAFLEIAQGRLEEASETLRRAAVERPLNTSVAELLCWVEYLSGRFDSALSLLADARESGHCGAILDTVEAFCRVVLSGAEDQIQRLETLSANAPRNNTLLGVLGYAYGKTGKTEAARQVIDSMSRVGLTGVYDFAYPIALTYAGIGEPGEVRRWLAQSYRHGSLWSIGFNSDPMLVELRKGGGAEGLFGPGYDFPRRIDFHEKRAAHLDEHSVLFNA
jgi:Flp pilus assembly protein TadD